LTNRQTKMQRMARVARAFTPGGPVDRLDMLAGRHEQTQDIVSAVSQRGQHVGLYGERGVGKTSLANVLGEFFDAEVLPSFQVAAVNCATDDTYGSLWKNVLAELGIDAREHELSPDAVRRELRGLDPPALIKIDELDRLEDDEALTLLADTIKTLSDHSVPSTLVLVGVARSIGDLIGEHASIVRALVQIEMPRMTTKELRQILEKGCDEADLTIRTEAAAEITLLSEGLPHYTHLLGLHAGQRVVQDDRSEITLRDVTGSIPRAVERHTIQSDYQRATRSAHKEALFREVLLACALAPKNRLGFFTAGSIRDPLEVIAGRRIDIPAFARHLSQFLESERSAVLQREGSPRRYFYRFSDPILQPYVVLTGLSEGLITDEQIRYLKDQGAGGVTPSDAETTEPQRLF
jgi:Cdc6-like AAA superfamily ATPase